jgi:hypothetical protein
LGITRWLLLLLLPLVLPLAAAEDRTGSSCCNGCGGCGCRWPAITARMEAVAVHPALRQVWPKLKLKRWLRQLIGPHSSALWTTISA